MGLYTGFDLHRGKIIQIDEGQVKDHLGEIVRGTVQETLNTLLDEEAIRWRLSC